MSILASPKLSPWTHRRPPLEQALEWAPDREQARRWQTLRWQILTGWVSDWTSTNSRRREP